MSTIELSTKAKKLVTLCQAEGFTTLDQLLETSMLDVVCANICMQEDCDHIEKLEKDQERGWCSECQSNTMVSALVLAELI